MSSIACTSSTSSVGFLVEVMPVSRYNRPIFDSPCSRASRRTLAHGTGSFQRPFHDLRGVRRGFAASRLAVDRRRTWPRASSRHTGGLSSRPSGPELPLPLTGSPTTTALQPGAERAARDAERERGPADAAVLVDGLCEQLFVHARPVASRDGQAGRRQ